MTGPIGVTVEPVCSSVCGHIFLLQTFMDFRRGGKFRACHVERCRRCGCERRTYVPWERSQPSLVTFVEKPDVKE